MEELVDRGLVRHIGTSNMTIPKMRLLLRDATIKPVANEMGFIPIFQQPEFFRYLIENGIQPIAFPPSDRPPAPNAIAHRRTRRPSRVRQFVRSRSGSACIPRWYAPSGLSSEDRSRSRFGEPAQYS
jgi:diketogulonate reductase-like aldo/keto reductase